MAEHASRPAERHSSCSTIPPQSTIVAVSGVGAPPTTSTRKILSLREVGVQYLQSVLLNYNHWLDSKFDYFSSTNWIQVIINFPRVPFVLNNGRILYSIKK